jgi:hypothetical protein
MGASIMPYEKYDIDFYKLAAWMSPRWLRKQGFLIIIRALVYPLVLIHNAFIRYRDLKLYEIHINYQVCYLEAFLNDRYDFVNRNIYIADAEIADAVYLYQDEELKPMYLYTDAEDRPVYLYTDGESSGDLLNDFIVFVPAYVDFQEAELRAMIAKNLSGKRYSIQIF